jgi:predicted nucleic acid-binding Zn ribbon protein
MKRKKLTLPQKTFYDLACSQCRQVHIFDAMTMSATTFCSQCQAITIYPILSNGLEGTPSNIKAGYFTR